VLADAERCRVVALRGEWDIANAYELRTAFSHALGDQPGTRVTLDLTDATFMDLCALAAVVALHRSAVACGGGVEVLCRGDGCVHRTLTVSGLSAVLDVRVVDVHPVGHGPG
jgi:anti-anti-sigma factor